MIQDYSIEIKFLCGYVRNILSENFRVLIDRLQYKLGNVSYRKQHVNECQPEEVWIGKMHLRTVILLTTCLTFATLFLKTIKQIFHEFNEAQFIRRSLILF